MPETPPNLARVIKQTRQNPKVLDALFSAVSSATARERFGAAKRLRDISQHAPDLLYPRFDFFVDLMESENRILRWNAILILGNLAAADEQRRIDRLLDQYLGALAGPHLIDAANTIRGATAIALARPDLAGRIARDILQVEHARYETAECRNVAAGHAITALEQLFPLVANQRAVHLFVSRQRENRRPATRHKAEKFLRKWPIDQRAQAGGSHLF